MATELEAVSATERHGGSTHSYDFTTQEARASLTRTPPSSNRNLVGLSAQHAWCVHCWYVRVVGLIAAVGVACSVLQPRRSWDCSKW
jgi:hypothetical protein